MVQKITKAMVMSAGMGSRLEPLTLIVPKPLVPVANRPVMDILFENLANIGIKDIVCNTYYLADQIIERYKTNDLDINFNYIREDTLSGTAGGLKKCQFFFDEDETFVVISADVLTNANILEGIRIHKDSGAIATIGIKEIPKEEVSHFGVVVADKDGFITEFQEKPPVEDAKSNFINTGIYIFNYKIFDYIPENTFYDFAKDVFPKLLKEKQISTFVVDDYWNDVGTIQQYKISNHDAFSGKFKFNHDQIHITSGGAYISSSKIPTDTKFIGESVVGSNCGIGKNVILENSVIWNNVKIADDVHIKNSVIASDEIIACNISDKIVGNNKLLNTI